jgi:HPt (histidine-containing phosphotransfer) domain-containing protein
MSILQFTKDQPVDNVLLQKPERINVDVLDLESLNAFEDLQIENEADLIVELIDLYVAELPTRIGEIRLTAKADKWAQLRRAVHNLKGSSANLGISRVAATCAEIERMDEGDLPSQSAEIIQRLEQEVDKAAAALAAVRQGRTA